MDTNTNKQTNDSAPTIDEILGLFKTLNEPAQDAAMSVLRLADAIRKGVLPDDSRAPMMALFDNAFDAGEKG